MTAFAFSIVKINNVAQFGVRSPDYQPREKQLPADQDGTVWQTSSPVIRAAPMLKWSTVAVKTLLALFGTTSRPPYVALDGVNGIEVIGAKINATGPGYDATAVHASRKCLNGLVMLAGLSWKPGDVVEASCEAFLTGTAGGTNPVVTATVAAPTIPVNTEQLVLSSITGIPSTRILSLDVAISHQVENNDDVICYNAGLPYPLLCKQPGVAGPVEWLATFETTDLTTALTNGTITVVFGVLNHNGVGLAAGTATLVLNNCQIREEGIAGKPGSRKVTARATWDGTSYPGTIATA